MGRYATWLGGGAALPGEGVHPWWVADGRGQYSVRGGEGSVLVNFTTPVIINDRRARLDKIIVLYETPTDNKITLIEVHDGSRVVAQRSVVAEGDYSGGLVPENVIEIPERPEILYGVFLYIVFESSVFFRGFGADFIV
jgi:hypothetical protein